jgi:predicted  nucleic acid-binding Zn-ribbon protein
MSAKLVSFQYEPRGMTGWFSPVLEFGPSLTSVGGDNGAGKTPVMKGIMAALGHEVSLHPEIIKRCVRARIEILVDGELIVLARVLDEVFELHVSGGRHTKKHTDQTSFSTWLLELLGIQQRALTSTRRESTPIYLSIFYPLLWVDQDAGWTALYTPPANRNFVQSQYSEMVRAILGLAPRHPFRSRDDYDKAKRRLEAIDKHIESHRFLVVRLRGSVDSGSDAGVKLRERRDQLRAELALKEKTLDALRTLTQRHDETIARLEGQRAALLSDRSSLLGRQRQLELALNEIDGEVEVLAANVQATDLFRQFCGREECKLFQPHSESYGRTLLFLKDQMKDMKSADGTLAKEVTSVAHRVASIEADLSQARAEREAVVTASPHAQVHARLEAVTKELVDVELKISKFEQLAGEEQRFERSLNEREQQLQLIDKLKPRGERRDEVGVLNARQALQTRMDEWLETLGTPNLPRGVSVDEDFQLVIGGEVFSRDSSISGSTRTRVVLAFHAALLEVSLDVGGNHPGWLLLDAPKQHELSQTDLNAYFGRLSDISRRHPGAIQSVFSIANTEVPLGEGDEVWMPTNGAGRSAKYLHPLPLPPKS